MQAIATEEATVPLLVAVVQERGALGEVLVAEDDPLYRRTLEGLLSGKGYDVHCVTDGLQALDRARSANPPRLLILDWMMPGLQGPDVEALYARGAAWLAGKPL